jgi:hypothetical protein
MKKIFLLLTLATCVSGSFAQISDSAVLGPSYTNDVYYSMKDGQVASVDGTNWHLAFSTRGTLPPSDVMRSVTVMANEARGVRIFEAPAGTTVEDWNSFDTAGYTTWSNPHNSDTTWDIGAFNINRNHAQIFDFGWGTYDLQSHNVYGSKMFLVRITTGSGPSAVNVFKKLTIESLEFDTVWNFSYANLDNSDSTHTTINKRNYNGKLFAYYNLNTNTAIDREPASWDIVFTRYATMVTQMGQTIFSTTTGVLSHPAVVTSKVSGKPTNEIDAPEEFTARINNIGTDWKINPGPGQPNFVMKDSLAYFTKRTDGQVDKIVFTGLTTSATGVVYFNRTNITLPTGVKNAAAIGQVSMFPNPASESVVIELEANKTYTVTVFDITGKSHMSSTAKGSHTLDISGLKNGIYFVSIQHNGAQKTVKLIVQ